MRIEVPRRRETALGTWIQVPTLALTFHFDADAVGQNAVATITPITPSVLPTPLVKTRMANRMLVPAVTANGTCLAGFKLDLNPLTIAAFNVPVTIGGTLGDLVPENVTINLAMLVNNLGRETPLRGDFHELSRAAGPH
ncbi:MAG: hypothetical protein ACLGP3_12615 [Acidobacteriota bacterium]